MESDHFGDNAGSEVRTGPRFSYEVWRSEHVALTDHPGETGGIRRKFGSGCRGGRGPDQLLGEHG